jgi:hypothetical protein
MGDERFEGASRQRLGPRGAAEPVRATLRLPATRRLLFRFCCRADPRIGHAIPVVGSPSGSAGVQHAIGIESGHGREINLRCPR